jgi:hypothetical protein
MDTMKRISLANNPEAFIAKAIEAFTRQSPANRRKIDGGQYWDRPLVGFASGADPLFRQYKKVIGRFHFTPREIFNLTFRRSAKTPAFQSLLVLRSRGYSQEQPKNTVPSLSVRAGSE